MIVSLEKLKKEIEHSSLAKSDFLSNMSHEIRFPINAMVGFSETIFNNPNSDPESTRIDIEHIATAGNNLLDIIDIFLRLNYGDSTKVFQVLLSILTNSIKYTEVGRIKLSAVQETKNNNITKEDQKYIIFLDHMMPEIDGIEVIHIFGVRDMYLKEGFDEYLSKPINISELNRIIRKYFGINNDE